MVGQPFWRFMVLLAVAFAAAGCASKFEADVTRFHQLAEPDSRTVAVVARDPGVDRSIEFERYAGMIRERLIAEGFTAPADGITPDIMAEVSYGVGEGRRAIRDGGDNPVSVGVGVGGGSRSGVGVGVSTGFGIGGGSSGSTFMRHFELVLTRAADGRRLFEGRVISEGKSHDLPAVMPLMIDALFEDFPGVSGSTRSISRDMPN